MDIGILEYISDNVFQGTIGTLALSLQIELQRRDYPKKSDKEPEWDVYAVGVHGLKVKVGVAWECKIRKGDKVGQSMWQLKLDDPSFDHPLDVSAFPAGDGRVWYITFERDRGARATAQQAASPTQQAEAA